MVAQARAVAEHLDPPTYVATAYIEEKFGVTPKTVRRWVAEGRLTGYRLGPRLIRYDRDEVDNLLRPIPTTEAK